MKRNECSPLLVSADRGVASGAACAPSQSREGGHAKRRQVASEEYQVALVTSRERQDRHSFRDRDEVASRLRLNPLAVLGPELLEVWRVAFQTRVNFVPIFFR